MTVHEMPRPGDVVQADAQRTRMGRWKMIAMLLVCASPVIASYFTYYVVRPEGRRNYGELIQPQKDMPKASAQNLQGEAVPLASLKGQWLLVNVGSGACAERCQQNLYFQRQLREILGRDKDRLDRVWLITDDAPVSESLLPALNMAHVLRLDAAKSLAAFTVAKPGETGKKGQKADAAKQASQGRFAASPPPLRAVK
jgi:hypothetical protein